MKQKFLFIFIAIIFCAQQMLAQKIHKTQSGLQYHFFKKNRKGRKAKANDIVFYQLILKNSFDSTILNTAKEFGEQQISIGKPTFKGDLMEALSMLHYGDSVLFLIPVDSLYKNALPYFAQANTCMKFVLKAGNIMTQNEYDSVQKKQKKFSLNYDDSLLHILLNRLNTVPNKLPSGVYVGIKNKGIARKIIKGDTIKVNYTGRLVNGKVFDSNVDNSFNHEEPFKFVVGKGDVIKGWDEALLTLNYGCKATLYIPSALAYGKKQMGAIPASSILIFDIEVLEK